MRGFEHFHFWRAGWLNRINVWAVVQRELREGARRPVNHRLRFCSVIAGMLLLWIIVDISGASGPEVGSYLLGGLHSVLLGLIFLVVPASAAECIAREKREGTLGLLFLTPLSASGIVAGKALVQGLRALILWLSLVPLLTIPFLAGAITWTDALCALSLEFSASLLCLAAGLLASSLARERNWAFFLAFVLAGLFLIVFSQLLMVVLMVRWRGFAIMHDWLEWSVEITVPMCSGILPSGMGSAWGYLGLPSVVRQTWLWLCGMAPIAAALIFLAISWFAAARVERSWQDRVTSVRREKVRRRFCTPIFQRWFKRRSRLLLDRNPIAWLQQYSWKARVSKWVLFLAFLFICYAAGHLVPLGWLLLTLGGFYVFAGVSSFLEDKRSGVLEILLVTPISSNQLIFGRTRGLWSQFLPAGLVLAGFFANAHYRYFGDGTLVEGPAVALVCTFLALPIFATYFALRVKGLLLAAAWTSIAGFIPYVFAFAAAMEFTRRGSPEPLMFSLAIVMSYGLFAYLACFLLGHSLSRRIYAF